ncbi:MAG: rRNA maturation RNase YbeY [Acidimicrobiaceae bacterium]|nr:rRNA maturation RNase YbeY [Acidimicrobiaceae bacterium]
MVLEVNIEDKRERRALTQDSVSAEIIVDTQRWADLACAVLAAENVITGELGLLFVDVEEMAWLNSEHRGMEKATDVLAFPIDGRPSDGCSQLPAAALVGTSDQRMAPPVLIGDVVICPSYALANIADYAEVWDSLISNARQRQKPKTAADDYAEVCDSLVSSAGRFSTDGTFKSCGGLYGHSLVSSAGRFSADLDSVLALLVVHGVLHVLGYDHVEVSDAEIMRTRERELLLEKLLFLRSDWDTGLGRISV